MSIIGTLNGFPPKETLEQALGELGLLGHDFSRSLVAPSAKPISSTSHGRPLFLELKKMDSPNTYGPASDAEGRVRVEWFLPSNTEAEGEVRA
jgi:hypothetical protein